jgi:hypothetical protein
MKKPMQTTTLYDQDFYSKLSTLLLKVSGVQPSAPAAMIEMLIKAVEQAQATVDAGEATIKEARSDWSI